MHAVCVTVSMYSVLHHCYMYHVFLYSSQCPHARPTVADIYPKQYGAEVCAVCYMKMHKIVGEPDNVPCSGNVWQIAKSKLVGEKKFEWIDSAKI